MEIFGLHEYIKDVTRRLAKLGAFAVAPDYYFRKGSTSPRSPRCRSSCRWSTPSRMRSCLSDLDATVAWAKAQGGDTSKLGIIGFCRGGRTVWEYAAHSSDLKAGVAFYGPLVDAAESGLAEEPDPARARDEGARARPLWREPTPAFPWPRSKR